MRKSYISGTVQPRITKFYTILHTHRVDNHTGYDVTICFRSEVIDVRKRADNDASDGFNPESPKLAHYIHTDILIKHTEYYVTDYFRLAVIEVQKRAKMPNLTASLMYISRAV